VVWSQGYVWRNTSDPLPARRRHGRRTAVRISTPGMPACLFRWRTCRRTNIRHFFQKSDGVRRRRNKLAEAGSEKLCWGDDMLLRIGTADRSGTRCFCTAPPQEPVKTVSPARHSDLTKIRMDSLCVEQWTTRSHRNLIRAVHRRRLEYEI